MSLDIWLTAQVEAEVACKNITHNLSEMWKEAGIYDALYKSEGKTANEILPTLETGLQLMIANPESFQQFNSPNGWGLYKSAIPWLSDLIVEFKKHPDGVIGISV